MFEIFGSSFLGMSAGTANWIVSIILLAIAAFALFLLVRAISRPRMAGGRRSKNARLAITDAASIDERRRLVLVRRDDVEHLIMIGGATDMVIESYIVKDIPARAAASPSNAPLATPASRSLGLDQQVPPLRTTSDNAPPLTASRPAPAPAAPPAAPKAPPLAPTPAAPSLSASPPLRPPAKPAPATPLKRERGASLDELRGGGERPPQPSKTSVSDDMSELLSKISSKN